MQLVLDTTRTVPTPEGIELSLRLAGPLIRSLAWLIDLAIRLGVFMTLGQMLAFLSEFGAGVFFICWFIIDWFYPVLFEVYWRGATPGKRACHLAVLHDDGSPVGWSASFARNLIRIVDFLPFCYGFGLVAMLLNRDFKRLGDLAAGTVVVYVDQQKTAAKIPAAQAMPAPLPLKLAEQRAVIDFAQRQPMLTAERAAEIAELATPLVGDARGHTASIRLMQIANFLLGRR